MGILPLEEHDGIALLKSVFGARRRDGSVFGTDVVVEQVGCRYNLESLALETFKQFLGKKNLALHGEHFLAGWRESIAILPSQAPFRKPVTQILNESEDENLEGSIDMLTENWDNPEQARQGLAGGFDCQEVNEMAIYSIDDGGLMYGTVIACHMNNGKYVGLVGVFDDQAY